MQFNGPTGGLSGVAPGRTDVDEAAKLGCMIYMSLEEY